MPVNDRFILTTPHHERVRAGKQGKELLTMFHRRKREKVQLSQKCKKRPQFKGGNSFAANNLLESFAAKDDFAGTKEPGTDGSRPVGPTGDQKW
jgi:hypothetical protein